MYSNIMIFWTNFGADLGPNMDPNMDPKLDQKWNQQLVKFAPHAKGRGLRKVLCCKVWL